MEKTGNDKCHCPFSRRTAWAFHFLGPPSGFSNPNSRGPTSSIRVIVVGSLPSSISYRGSNPCCCGRIRVVPLSSLKSRHGGEFLWLSWTRGCSPHRWRVKISPHPSAREGARVGLRRSCFGGSKITRGNIETSCLNIVQKRDAVM